jgi:hypothetical protein
MNPFVVWQMTSTRSILHRHLADLSRAYRLWIGDGDEFVIITGVNLPPGHNMAQTDLLVELPSDYPLSPPGVGDSRIFVPAGIRRQGRQLRHVHEGTTPDFETPKFGPWAWWCYSHISWDPCRDNLIKFVEMVRADFTSLLKE